MNIAIANHGRAVGKYLPERIVDNTELETIFASNNVTTSKGEPLTAGWMEKHPGADIRHWAAEDEFASHMGIIAAKRAIRKGGISPYHLSAIRVGSSTPDFLYPGLSCLIQNGLVRVGQPNLHLDAYDISAACAGGLRALASVAETMICHPAYQYGLAGGTDTMSKMVDPTDSNSQVWADAAVFLVLEQTQEDRGIICSVFGSAPEAYNKTESIGLGARYLHKTVTPNAKFIGPEVQKYVIKEMIEIIPETIRQANIILRAQRKRKIRLADIKMFATHQANSRIFQKPARDLGIPLEKFYVNFPSYCNTSTASVLLCLADMIEQELVGPGDLVMLISFGGGLISGSILLRI